MDGTFSFHDPALWTSGSALHVFLIMLTFSTIKSVLLLGNPQNLAGLAFVLAGRDHDKVIFLHMILFLFHVYLTQPQAPGTRSS